MSCQDDLKKLEILNDEQIQKDLASLNELYVLNSKEVREGLQQLEADRIEADNAVAKARRAARQPKPADVLKYWGVIDARGEQYSLQERLHMIRCLSRWGANLYIFGQLSWGESIKPISGESVEEFKKIAEQCTSCGVQLWVWMKPGDHRYAFHRSDRRTFIENAKRYMELGAEGFYLLMDDLHPKDPSNPAVRVRPKDAVYHAKLIAELYDELGDRFKAICGEHYHGDVTIGCCEYWGPIMDVLPSSVMVTWTGPRIWNRTLQSADVPNIDRPILLFDNYFASDTDDPKRSPIYPYDGRTADLAEKVSVAVINPNNHYAWQFCAFQTAMDFWRAPGAYDPEASFKQAVRDLGDRYVSHIMQCQE